MLLEEGFECHTGSLPRLVWLPMQQSRTLTDKGCELGSPGRICS